jgi:hypothetical protein
MTLPTSGWCEVIVPIALYTEAGGVAQYLWEDAMVPYGLTYSAPRTIAFQVADSKLQAVNVTETYVRGELRYMTVPAAVDVIELTDQCPS